MPFHALIAPCMSLAGTVVKTSGRFNRLGMPVRLVGTTLTILQQKSPDQPPPFRTCHGYRPQRLALQAPGGCTENIVFNAESPGHEASNLSGSGFNSCPLAILYLSTSVPAANPKPLAAEFDGPGHLGPTLLEARATMGGGADAVSISQSPEESPRERLDDRALAHAILSANANQPTVIEVKLEILVAPKATDFHPNQLHEPTLVAGKSIA